MQTQQLHFINNEWKAKQPTLGFIANEAQLVILFGSRELIGQKAIFDQ